MQSAIDPRSRRTILILAVGFVVLLVAVGGRFLLDRGGDGDGASSTVVGDGTGDLVDGSAWAGRYRWDEFVEGDPGSDQTLIHELELDVPGDPALGDPTGRLVQNGFQTATELTVVARPIDDGVAIEVVSVVAGRTVLRPGDVAIRLTGDPASPITTIDALVPLVADRPPSGTYFVPDDGRSAADDRGEAGDDEAAGDDGGAGDQGGNPVRPATFWAIDAERFDLIEIETATGAEVERITGWAGDPAMADESFFQALQRVDVTDDGWLWVDDCCEPAAGNIFGLDPGRIGSLADVLDGPATDPASRRLIGLNPIASPDGTLVAYGNHTFGVAVVDRDGREVASVPGADPDRFPTPLAWLDDVTLAVAEAGVDQTTIMFWDLRDPSRPVPVGTTATVAGVPVDGASWSGAVLVVLGPEPFGDARRTGVLVDLDAVEPVDVPDGLRSIDHDASGRHLLVVGADGLARTGPPDGSGPALSDIEVIWASW